MTSSNGNIFRVTGHLSGEFTGPGEFPAQRPVTRSFAVFFDLSLNKRLSKQSRCWWFETQSHPLWRHCNGKSRAAPHHGKTQQSAKHVDDPWDVLFLYKLCEEQNKIINMFTGYPVPLYMHPQYWFFNMGYYADIESIGKFLKAFICPRDLYWPRQLWDLTGWRSLCSITAIKCCHDVNVSWASVSFVKAIWFLSSQKWCENQFRKLLVWIVLSMNSDVC